MTVAFTFRAIIADLDGVVTDSASLHARAWKSTFDELLQRQSSEPAPRPFDLHADYRRYIDGKPRLDGARSFLASRNLNLPEGTEGDSPGLQSVHALAKKKNELYLQRLDQDGVKVFEDAVRFLERQRSAGTPIAMATSSRNGMRILKLTGLSYLFEACVDGVQAQERGLRGKPAPDLFLEAAHQLNMDPARCLLLEDAAAGVEAGCAGNFGLVVGIARGGAEEAEALQAAGAHLLVHDLDELEAALAGDTFMKGGGER